MSRTVIVAPDPARMMEGLRDTGYQFETAMADIIDNSIAAEATTVEVDLSLDYAGDFSIRIVDNGVGMDEEGLVNAMRYGSRPRPNAASLGKFGLGLKTASTAFCRRLSLISRAQKSAPFLCATWDLDHVCTTGEWQLMFPHPEPGELARLDSVAGTGTGTLVLWENVDRLMRKYADPGGVHARRAVERINASLRAHVGLVFQRFLDPSDIRARNVTIRINGVDVDPIDPFAEGVSELVAQQEMAVQMDADREAGFQVRAFVLPRRQDIDDPVLRERVNISNDRQGIYVYREDRLIHGPGWMGMYGKEPHFSLSRVEFSFDHRLDEAFHIDIKKSQIILNEDLYQWFKDQFLNAPRRAAEQRYRQGQRKQATVVSRGAHDASNNAIHEHAADLDSAKIEVIDRERGQVRVTNRNGQVTIRLRITGAAKPGQVHVQPADGIEDGLLWEPALIDGNKAVRINTGHPYYHRVYVPNFADGVTVQGMDSLLWALCAAELNAVNEHTRKYFSEIRFEVSRLLRVLVEDLPDMNEVDGESAA